MKNTPIRRCAADGCGTLSASDLCSRHRRAAAGKTISAAEASLRLREDAEINGYNELERAQLAQSDDDPCTSTDSETHRER